MDPQYTDAIEYSNNEGSVAANNPPPPASATAAATAPTPAKTSSKHAPQAGIDKFWRKFTTKHPGKVNNVLPADLYAKTKAGKGSPGVKVAGQRAGKSYEQAAAECKNAVIKIAKECRRVNAKYRDPHFDIEFDLKSGYTHSGPRDCLDGLSLSDRDMRYNPRSVKRVADIFEKPEFYQDEATASDVRQGSNGDCWFLSALCALTNKRNLIDRICVARDEGVGVYGFVFYRDGEWIQTIVDDKLYLIASDWWESSDQEKKTTSQINRDGAEEAYRKLNQTGSKSLYFAQCRSENETWLPLLEKAYAKAHGDYSAIDGGFTGEAIEDLTGGVTQELFTTDLLDKDKFWKDELLKVNDEFLFSCSTGAFDKWQGSDAASNMGARGGVIRLHAYSIMDAVERKGLRLVKVRNPWATDEWRGAWSDGSEQWTAEWLQLLDHKFGDDGIFWISYEDLLQRYSSFDRTRLFGKEWHVAQRWAALNVSWSADYNVTKFSVILTKRSPVVIVLSQIDDRYFKGLEGQYLFELHFRLDRDGSDDYIVRSHGNYSMRRSVSTDIELDAGKYSVLMKIRAVRYDDDPTPAAVVKENVKNRPNKLIQVGLSYDLAHAKGEMTESPEERKLRKEEEQKNKLAERKKKRELFRAQEYRKWEIGKRQRARNQRRQARREAYAKKKAEKQQTTANNGTETDTGVNGTNVAAGIEKEIDQEAAVAASNGLVPTANGAAESKGNQIESIPETAIEQEESSNGVDAANTLKASESGSDQTLKSTISESTPGPTNATLSTAEPIAESSTNPSGAEAQTDPSAPSDSDPQITDTAPQPETNEPETAGAAANAGEEDDDPDAYLYSDSASFVSSIDSLLDFPEEDNPLPTSITSTPPSPILGPSSGSLIDDDDEADDDDDNNNGDDEDNAEFAADPWNAVCVVGLRVFSKDEKCEVKVVRPKKIGNAESVLDLDDTSKGVSGEIEGSAPGAPSISTDISNTTAGVGATAAHINGNNGYTSTTSNGYGKEEEGGKDSRRKDTGVSVTGLPSTPVDVKEGV